jgi:fatty-acyl-CoA synthase
MAVLSKINVRSRADIARIEAEMTLAQRLPERSVLDVFIGAAARAPDRTALTMLMTGEPDEQPRRVSYRELLGLVRRAANLFATLAGPRPTVAYMLPSLVETQATLWGAETAGVAVPINFLLQPESIAALLAASGARILVALGPHPSLDIWQKALALRERVPGLTLLRVAPRGTPLEEGVLDFHAALMAQPDDRLVFGEPGGDDDIAAYFHTGGTTGTPKLVAHTHRGQLVAALGGALMGGSQADDISTGTLPLFHVGGTISGSLSVFMAGAELLVMSPAGLRNPTMVRGFWRLVAQYRATRIGAVPTSIGAVLDVPLGGADLSHVRAGFTGAASLPAAVGQRFRQVTGHALNEIYGMTEASGLIAIHPPGDDGADGGVGSVGWALPYTQVVVCKPGADGRLGPPCAPREIGVVTVRGPHVSPGYRNPAHDAGVIEDGGVLNSGDLGYIDDEGRLYIAGRAKDLIIRSGHNIDPLMIENALAAHPAVALAAAVGMPDAYAGELPVCYVALKPGAVVTEDELQAHAQRTIGERPAWPKQIHIVESIPLTSVGKIYKPQLRCDAAAWLVARVLREQCGVADVRVQVSEGGRRGLRVSVLVQQTARGKVAALEQALAKYLFETEVVLASA